jgi:hypothetical protein
MPLRSSLIASVLAAAYCGLPVTAVAAPQPSPLLSIASYNFLDTEAPPVVASGSGGGYVAAWQTHIHTNQDWGPAQIRAYAADGTPASPVIEVGKKVVGNASVAMDADGDFVAAWVDAKVVFGYTGEFFTGEIYAQRFSPAGVAQGRPQAVAYVSQGVLPIWAATLHMSALTPVRVAADDDGDYVVAWSDNDYVLAIRGYNSQAWSYSKTYVASYRANGTPIHTKKVIDRVSLATNGFTVVEGLAMNAGGDFVIASDSVGTSLGNGTHLQAFNLQLAPLGSAVSVSGNATVFAGVGIDNTDNVALLQSMGGGALVSRYSASGTSLGSSSIAGAQPAALAMAGTGEFAVLWNETATVDLFGDGQTENTARKQLQYFKPDGSTDGAPVTVDSGLAQINDMPSSLAMDASGAAVAIWPSLFPDYSLQLVGRSISPP